MCSLPNEERLTRPRHYKSLRGVLKGGFETMKAMTIALSCLIASAVFACQAPQPVPVECICDCTSPEALKSAAAAPTSAKSAANSEASGAAERQRRAKKLEAARDAKRTAALNKLSDKAAKRSRSAEVVRAEPGTGDVVRLEAPAHRAMSASITGILRAVGSRDLAAMEPFMTTRLYESLSKSMTRYEERFFGGLRPTAEALPGGFKIAETRSMGRGNVEALLRFKGGHERRIVFFEQRGTWLVNRL